MDDSSDSVHPWIIVVENVPLPKQELPVTRIFI